jgi:hypothetical protein
MRIALESDAEKTGIAGVVRNCAMSMPTGSRIGYWRNLQCRPVNFRAGPFGEALLNHD